MRAKILVYALATLVLATTHLAEAQQPTKVFRIGFLGGNSPNLRSETFRQRLRELGYVEGKNIVIEWRHHGGKLDRLPALADELVRLKVDIIMTVGAPAARAAKGATVTIPVVMMQVGDPVGSGFVASLARPGGNITGLSSLAPELGGKRLELLKEIVPRLTRVAVFGTSTNPDNAQSLREVELAAKAFGVKLQYLDVLSPKDFETAFQAASKGRAEALLYLVAGAIGSGRQTEIVELAAVALKLRLEEIETQPDPKALDSAFQTAKKKQVNAIMTIANRRFFAERKRIVELAGKTRLPAMYPQKEFVDEGGLMSYGADYVDLYRRTAVYVDKILKGTKPADLPVQQATKFDFVINLKAAKQIGLTLSPEFLSRANQVIK